MTGRQHILRETDAAFRARHLVCDASGSRNPLGVPASNTSLASSHYGGYSTKKFTHQYTGPYPGHAAWPNTAGEWPNLNIK